MKGSIEKKIIFFAIVAACEVSCGDIFSYTHQIDGKYYLVEGESSGCLSISYSLGMNTFIQRIPPCVQEYAIIDSLIVGKTKSSSDTDVKYFVINQKKDSDIAKEKNFMEILPCSEAIFKNYWGNRPEIHFNQVPDRFRWRAK